MRRLWTVISWLARPSTWRQDCLGFRGVLGAALDEDLPALIHRGQCCLGFQVEMLLAGKFGDAGNDLVGSGQGGIGVPAADGPVHALEGVGLDGLGHDDEGGSGS